MNCCCVACFCGDRNTASRLQYQALPPELEPLIKAGRRDTSFFFFYSLLLLIPASRKHTWYRLSLQWNTKAKHKTPLISLLFLNRCLPSNSNNPAAHVWRSTVRQRQTGNRCGLFPGTLGLNFCQRINLLSNSKPMKKNVQHVWTVKDLFPALAVSLISGSLIGHSLISSCRWILPLLLSRKDTWVSLYCVMTSTNFLDRTVCWNKRQKQKPKLLAYRSNQQRQAYARQWAKIWPTGFVSVVKYKASASC